MISVEKWEAIRQAYFVENKKIREISRESGLSRQFIRQAITSSEPKRYTLKTPRSSPVLGPYKARIMELLTENKQLPRKQRYTGRRIFQIIQKEGYAGSESSVRGFIGQLRTEKRKRPVYIPLEFDPGSDAQVDWGEAQAIIADEQVTVQFFVMRLCFSRRLFMMAFPCQKQEAFLAGHVHAFRHFHGVPRRISYDNLKIAVKHDTARQETRGTGDFHPFSRPLPVRRATFALRLKAMRKAGWKVASASPDATSWFPSSGRHLSRS